MAHFLDEDVIIIFIDIISCHFRRDITDYCEDITTLRHYTNIETLFTDAVFTPADIDYFIRNIDDICAIIYDIFFSWRLEMIQHFSMWNIDDISIISFSHDDADETL